MLHLRLLFSLLLLLLSFLLLSTATAGIQRHHSSSFAVVQAQQRLGEIRPITVSTLAGKPTYATSDDNRDGVGTNASFYKPAGIAFDAHSSLLYVADSNEYGQTPNQFRIINTTSAVVSTIPREDPETEGIYQMVLRSGSLYYASCYKNCVKRFDLTTGDFVTLAGVCGADDIEPYNYEEGPPFEDDHFAEMDGIGINSLGEIFVADENLNCIIKIDPNHDYFVSTYAGNCSQMRGGTADGWRLDARFEKPYAIAVDSDDNMYVSEKANNCIRKIDYATGTVAVFAGLCGAAAESIDGHRLQQARFANPRGIALDEFAGVLYVADTQTNKIRAINSTGYATTIAGNGFRRDVDGPGHNASFTSPRVLTLSDRGALFINTDYAIRIIACPRTIYLDEDGDGYGNSSLGLYYEGCFLPPRYASVGLDRDDSDPSVHPALVCFRDADGDSFGDLNSPLPLYDVTGTGGSMPIPPHGYVLDSTDCDDTDPEVNVYCPRTAGGSTHHSSSSGGSAHSSTSSAALSTEDSSSSSSTSTTTSSVSMSSIMDSSSSNSSSSGRSSNGAAAQHKKDSNTVLSVVIAATVAGALALIAIIVVISSVVLLVLILRTRRSRRLMEKLQQEQLQQSSMFLSSTCVSTSMMMGMTSQRHESQLQLQLQSQSQSQSLSIAVDDLLPIIDKSKITILSKIGQGSFGVVHKAEYAGDIVAIKQFKFADVEEDPERFAKMKADFEKEVTVLGRLRHPNVLFLVGVVLEERDMCIITEYMADGSLYDRLYKKQHLRLTWTNKLKVLLDVARGLQYLHKMGVIHRDLKSANILLSGDAKSNSITAKVADFGGSKLRQNSPLVQDAHLNTQLVGTVLWMAPEVTSGKDYGTECDVYSFAIIMAECLNERLPYHHQEFKGNIHFRASQDPFFRPLIEPDMDWHAKDPRYNDEALYCFISLMIACWQHDPASRPTIQEISNLLEAII